MFFSWIRRLRRRQLVAESFPLAWLDCLNKNVPHYGLLAPDERQRLRGLLRIFIAEKNWEGCGGLEITDDIRVTVAALACLLILNKDPDAYERLLSILVYPNDYVAAESQFPWKEPRPLDARKGESWAGGTVVLNWGEIQENIRHPQGQNLVLHEFAHQLDFSPRSLNRSPTPEDYEQWRTVLPEEFERLRDDARHDRPTLLDNYGAKNLAEFFAVSTECFFERGREMREQIPRLYSLLADYFQQDPATWRR